MAETRDDSAEVLEPGHREALQDAGIKPAVVSRERCSYRMLLDAGLDEDAADALRRQFSLPWSFETDGDLDRRSSEVRGLGEAERAWVAASADEGWQAFEPIPSSGAEAGAEDAPDRPWPRPTPVTAVTGVSPENAARLAEAGVNSAERLATIQATEVAKVLELSVLHVRTWRHNARELVD
ncbi:hypothetical protein NGM15_09715 [Natronosalvus halobius]|nr:hypothetical protein [Natronosalvus halobius]USZ73378.1 hypothetical protein NGM15_09715 [Natronosalvus halobius]